MNEDHIAFVPDASYVIPGRVIRILIDAIQDPPNIRTPLDKFIEALDSMGVLYQSETCCGNTEIHQVWFDLPGGYELVCEFDSTTEQFIGFYVEGWQ